MQIGGIPGGVFNFILTISNEGLITKLATNSKLKGPTTSRTIKKIKNSTMTNLA